MSTCVHMCVSDQTKARQNDRIVSWEVLSPNIIHLAVFEKKNNITLLYSVLPYLKVGLTKARSITRKDTKLPSLIYILMQKRHINSCWHRRTYTISLLWHFKIKRIGRQNTSAPVWFFSLSGGSILVQPPVWLVCFRAVNGQQTLLDFTMTMILVCDHGILQPLVALRTSSLY